MTPIPSPEAVQQVAETSGIEPAVIAALITGVVAIFVAVFGNLWSWYIARKTLVDSQEFERKRLDTLMKDERERHDADLRARHEESLRGDRIKALNEYNTDITKFIRYVTGAIQDPPSVTELLTKQGLLALLFNEEVDELSNTLAVKCGQMSYIAEQHRARNVKGFTATEINELVKMRNNFITESRKHIAEPPTAK